MFTEFLDAYMSIIAAMTIIAACLLPIFITLINLWNIFSDITKKAVEPRIMLFATLAVGFFDYIIYYSIEFDTAGDYYKVINTMQMHFSINSEYMLSFVIPCIVGITGLFIIGLCPAKYLPPLVSCFSIAAVIIGNVMNILFAVQIWENVELPMDLYYYVFHINVLLLSIFHIRRQIKEQLALIKMRNTQFRHKWIGKLYSFLDSAVNMSIFSFICVLPLAAVLELLLILLGQGPDGIVKAFTMTADWTFSTQIPPPPVEYDGHYLCTVAAGGHKNVVKPLRYGKRLGKPIIVNRQLCVANAFEELIAEKNPKFHKTVRHFYNTHGYPLSQIITTQRRADAVYILMKPLEWIFLLVLYMFDANPEERIARQYQWG